jgi:hypothetical protein
MPDAAAPALAVGDILTSFDMTVEAGKVLEFARATGADAEDLWTGPDAVAPPTFLTTMAFWRPPGAPLPFQQLGWSMRGLLHGGSEYSYPRGPVRVGSQLHVEIRLESLTTKTGSRGGEMKLATTAATFTDASQEVVAVIRTTLIKMGGGA